jgi:hypothetical protein
MMRPAKRLDSSGTADVRLVFEQAKNGLKLTGR